MAKKLWGSRFHKKTNILTERFTSSIYYDKKLAKYDVLGSIAHAKMLGKTKLLTSAQAKSILRGLTAILKEINNGKFRFDHKAEDIHTNIDNALRKKIGPLADRLHTARSRNDQIVLDVKMYCKDAIDGLYKSIIYLQRSIIDFINKNSRVIIPAYTHLQVAQCVLLSHHFLAYVEMMERDKTRLIDTRKRIDSMPLGSCALAGTGLPIDREFVRKELGFSKVAENSIDAVSDRDFIIELLSNLAILSVHLSRVAEDLILWSTKEFHFVDIDFSFCTGSSIMPHKKNPDVLELIRASVGKVHGDLSSVLILMKGLPLSYNRDLQLDKPPLFNGVETMSDILGIFVELFKNIKVNKKAIDDRLRDESLFSVDIMEILIDKGLSYRQAHDVTGKIVKGTLDKGERISKLTLNDLKRYSVKFNDEKDVKKIREVLNAWASVNRKRSHGGTNPGKVKQQIEKWIRKLK